MKKLRIFLEIQGLASGKDGEPCPGGLCVTIGEESAEEIAGEDYRKLMEQIDVAGILKVACLDGIFSPEVCRLLTPEEYDEKYGEDEKQDGWCR